MPSKSKLAAVAAAVAVLLPLSACGGNPTTAGSSGGSSTITVGSANFPENELLAEMYAQALQAKGVTVKTHLNIGARERYLAALKDGSINMVPEYNGALLAALSKGGVVPKDVNTSAEVNQALKKVLPSGTEILQSSPAEDKDTLSVMPQTARKYHLKAIPDLKPVAGKLVLGGPPEFAKRWQGVVGLKSVYGVVFSDFKPLDTGGPLTKAALKKGDIDVANIFSTDPQIQTDHFVVLDDPKNLFGAQNVTPVIAKSKASSKVTDAINAVSAALTTESLTKYRNEVEVEKKDPATVAKEFLDANHLS